MWKPVLLCFATWVVLFQSTASSSATENNFTASGTFDMLVVLPYRFQPREYFSPQKFPDASGREYPSGVLSLVLDEHPSRWFKFHSESLFDVDGTSLNTRGGVYNYDQVFQHKLYGVKFEEAWMRADLGALSAKIGIQKFAWGKLDALAPNDIVNPIELYNPFLSGLSGIRDSEVGIPAAQIGYYVSNSSNRYMPSESSFDGIWIPMYVPTRLSFLGERWFPSTLQANNVVEVNGMPVGVSVGLDNANPPARRLEHPSVGLKMGNTWEGLDLDFYYYYGYQTGFRTDAEAAIVPIASVPPGFNVQVATTLRPMFRRLQSFGSAAATTVGPFGLRAEVAFLKNQLFSRDLVKEVTVPSLVDELLLSIGSLERGGRRVPVQLPPLEVASDTVRSGASIDWTILKTVFIAQVNQTNILHPSRNLVTPPSETRALLTVRRSFLDNDLQLTVSGLYSIQGGDSFLEPTLQYRWNDHLSLTVGNLFIAGPRGTFLGEFKDNKEVFLRLRTSF